MKSVSHKRQLDDTCNNDVIGKSVANVVAMQSKRRPNVKWPTAWPMWLIVPSSGRSRTVEHEATTGNFTRGSTALAAAAAAAAAVTQPDDYVRDQTTAIR